MARLTFKKWFEHYKPDEETTTILANGYTQIVEVDEILPNNSNYFLVGSAIEKLAEYEDAEEQGLLLRLPCKVGDTVWCALEDSRYLYGGVYEAIVEEVEWSSYADFKILVKFKEDKQPMSYIDFNDFELGERVFFGDTAKEEAEQKLESMKGE